jgi:hypothetical protein
MQTDLELAEVLRQMVGLSSAMDEKLRLLASFAAPCRERAVEHAGPVQHHDCQLLFF